MKILLAHSDRDLLSSVGSLLRLDGYEVTTAFDGPQVISVALSSRCDALVFDLALVRMKPEEIVAAMRSESIPTIALTSERVTRKTLCRPGIASEYLEYPFTAAKLEERAERVVSAARSDGQIELGDAVIETGAFRLNGRVAVTASEIELFAALSEGRAPNVERRGVYADALNEKLAATGSRLRIRYTENEGFRPEAENE